MKEALLASASGCAICRLIAQELDYLDYKTYKVGTYQGHPAIFWIWPSGTSYVLEASVNLLRGTMNADHKSTSANSLQRSHGVGKITLKDPYKCRSFIVPVPDSYPTTSANIKIVKDWMGSCRDEHTVCARTRKSEPLPKRVLDISDASQNSILLYESSGETVPYVTVSYCWGVAATLKTTRTRLEQHTKGISLAAFPETLRDAILFAQGLGFRYVWIDALCIIQGDDSDWTEQARQMTVIYHGGALNIAIADAPNSDSGAVRRLKDCSVRIDTVSSGITADIYAVSAPIRRYEYLHGVTHLVTRLAKRGWVFQETLVSVASVYVTYEGLVWDCCTQLCRPGNAPQPARGFGHPVASLTPKATWARDNDNWAGLAPGRSHEDGIKRLRTLYGWVEQVSQRQLSKSRDKLPCLAGLVSRLASATSASYLAGLWREDLAVGLTWTTPSPGTLIRHADCAPSWSWASVDGPIYYIWCLHPSSKYAARVSPVEGFDLEVIDAWVDEIHPGMFGEVGGGRIIVRGTTWPATLRGKADRAIIYHPFKSDFIFEVDEARDWGESSACWILGVTQIYAYGASEKLVGPHILFLVVEESGASVDEFRRVGHARIDLSRGRNDYRPGKWDEQPITPGDRRTLVLV
jgi:hypothetical protein